MITIFSQSKNFVAETNVMKLLEFMTPTKELQKF